MITNLGHQVLTALLSGCSASPVIASVTYTSGSITNLYASSIQLGTHPSPSAPSATDTALYSTGTYLSTVTAITPSYPAAAKVFFHGMVPPAVSDGVTFTEVGLFDAAGHLICRQLCNVVKPTGLGVDMGITLSLSRAAALVVTDVGVSALWALLAGGAGNPTVGGQSYDPTNVSNLCVGSIAVGRLTTVTSPSTADTALNDPNPYSLGSIAVTYPTASTVKFTSDIPAMSPIAGDALTEEGLFLLSGDMFARTLAPSYAVPYGSLTAVSHTVSLT